MDAPATAPPPARSLKLTVSFIAFLAVLPLLVFVAYLSLKETEEKEQGRLWQLARMNASIHVATWFEGAYREALLAERVDGVKVAFEVKESDVREILSAEFPDIAKGLSLQDAALFWNTGTARAPEIALIGRVGSAEGSADSEILAAFQNGVPISALRGGGGAAHSAVQVSLPLQVRGEFRAVARLILPSQEWTVRGIGCASTLSAWIDDVRSGIIGKRPELAIQTALASPLVDAGKLKESLERSVEKVRESEGLLGLAIFLEGPTEDGKGRTLHPWLRIGSAPQDWTNPDLVALRTGEAPKPEKETDPAVVILPLRGNGPGSGIRGEPAGKPGVVAVAHFQMPAPPPMGAGSRFLLIIMMAAMALVLGFLFFYMNQAISQPIQRLIGAMTRGTAGDLQPIAQGGASGEVAQLALIYNRMVQENGKLMDQIRGFNEALKSKVRLATGELERRNEELRRANERLFGLQRELSEQQRLASLGQLAGTMAHELGTPLNAMSGHIELLLSDQGELPADVTKRLNLIGGQIERLSGIIQGNLQQLRAPAPRFVSVDLNALVQGIVSLVTPSVGARKVSIRTSLGTDLPRVAGDPAQLEQVLMNLVNNALDAMPGGGSLDLLTAMKESMVCLQVRDSGAGIPEADRKKIFDPFFTTKSPGKGTGLGLAICSEIVKSHSGTIDVQSEPGKGSWFTVRLPATEKLDGSGIRKSSDTPAQQPAAKAP